MGVRRFVGTCGLLLTLCLLPSCATVVGPVSPSLAALAQMQLRQRAGLYPAGWDVAGASHAAYLARLEAWAGEHGITVAPAPIGRKNLLGHVSYSGFAGWIVLINNDLSPNNRLHTLLHELGHVFGPRKTSIDASETIAEMIAASVCQQIGLDVWPQTAAYLAARVPFEEQTRAVHAHAAQIDQVIEQLSKAMGVEKP